MIGSRDEEPVHTPEASGDAPSTNAPSTAEDDDDDEGGTDPDKAITNAREARPEDGLLSTDDLSRLFAQAGAPVVSLYDEAQRLAKAQNTCGSRLELPPDRLGYHEPEWTSYTYYWKTVLGMPRIRSAVRRG
jgi:RNA exonuclease NGL2